MDEKNNNWWKVVKDEDIKLKNEKSEDDKEVFKDVPRGYFIEMK